MPPLTNGAVHVDGGAHPANGDMHLSHGAYDVEVDEDDKRLVMQGRSALGRRGEGRPSTSANERSYKRPPSSLAIPKQSSSGTESANTPADFFSPEVFRIVLHNPTTAHRLLRFSQARMCGENMEFLEKVGPLQSYGSSYIANSKLPVWLTILTGRPLQRASR